ncbi:MAG: DUF1330 domain-containing protein [Candidatus Hydrogenedentes bacterium]|nr:DUF1330 domain-containing protein [Candidatus Hydrogenedentota bacterium]
MSAYVIVQVNITDHKKYDAYKQMTPATIAQYGGRFIVRGGAREDLEGRWDVPRLVVIEFDSTETAKKWYGSREYQAAKAVREGGADMVFTVVEGVDAAPPG